MEKTYVAVDATLLIRTKDTLPQTSLSRAKRLKNVAGAFTVTGTPKPDSTYILIDDVTTTGTTILEAGKVLNHAGIKNCILLSLAH